MDFYEQIIKQQKQTKDYLVIAGTILGGLLFAAAGILFIPIFGLLWIFIPCWFGYFLISGHNLEYEYSITNHVMDVNRIAGKKRRQKMIVIDFKELQGCGIPQDREYKHAVRKGFKVLDFSSRSEEGQTWYFLVPRPKGTYVVILEPNETMLKLMRKYVQLER